MARDTIFLPEDFEELVLDFAARGESVGNVVGGTDAGSFASILGSMLAKAH